MAFFRSLRRASRPLHNTLSHCSVGQGCDLRTLGVARQFARAMSAVPKAEQPSEDLFASRSGWALTTFGASLAFTYLLGASDIVHSEIESVKAKPSQFYTRAQVAEHTTAATGIWVTYKDGVYDITDFVANHPGGSDKIMMAAGKAIDPFWQLYQQHLNKSGPQEILASMRIGTLDPNEPPIELDTSDPYAKDPLRHPALLVHSSKPCNAEAPLNLALDSWVTPSELWFVRHHHPAPEIDPATYKLTVRGEGIDSEHTFTLAELKKLPKRTVVSTIQCGGNRRSGLDEVQKTSGTAWGCGAISTAEWGGVYLREVLELCGLREAHSTDIEHVHFVAHDGMQASIPVKKAVDPYGDVLLAYEMNGREIDRDHGAPVRAIVPGHVGVRNVKFVTEVITSKEEATGMWQRGMAYKIFSPTVRSLDGVDVASKISMQEQNVQSAVVEPRQGAVLEGPLTELYCRGYAWSGGGRGIATVDVSVDGGATWHQAALKEGSEQKPYRAWAWTFWEAEVPLPPSIAKATEGSTPVPVQVICRAVDVASNSQPEQPEGIWNLRGLSNNSWHRVNVHIKTDE